ncbi:transposase family protein [Micromonospora sp. NPDC048999]|uniref:transposase family protein n=1 Tax=Micromonospora sp. NPDC048999 TaxID=3155391 RepID=UPI0033D580EE
MIIEVLYALLTVRSESCPALPSSLISSVSTAPAVTVPETAAGLPAALAALPDPRARRGVRHRLTVVVTAAVCAVAAGARPTERRSTTLTLPRSRVLAVAYPGYFGPGRPKVAGHVSTPDRAWSAAVQPRIPSYGALARPPCLPGQPLITMRGLAIRAASVRIDTFPTMSCAAAGWFCRHPDTGGIAVGATSGAARAARRG